MKTYRIGKRINRSLVASLAATAAIGMAASAEAATFPYSEDFNGATTPGDVGFTTTNGTWSIAANSTTGSDALQSTNTVSSSTNHFALTEVTGVGAEFTASVDMVINTQVPAGGGVTAANIQTGLYLGANSATGNTPGVLLDVSTQGWGGNTPGQMRIIGLGTNGSGGNDTAFTGQFNDTEAALLEDVVYTLTALLSDNGAGGLDISFTLSQAGGPSTTINGSITDASVLGDFFGVRSRTAASGTTVTHDISFDNYAIVPEPASLILAGLSSLMMLYRRR